MEAVALNSYGRPTEADKGSAAYCTMNAGHWYDPVGPYVCMYIYIYYMYVRLYICVYADLYICIDVYMQGSIHVYMHNGITEMWKCMCICVNVSM